MGTERDDGVQSIETEPDLSPGVQDNERTRLSYGWRVLPVVCLASFMTGLNNSSLNIALPPIVRHFEATAFEASWILLSFQLTSTVLMILFGRLADVFGRRGMYMTGVALFATASVLAGFSPHVWFLIACRVLQAVGGAMLITNSAALLTAAFPRRWLGQALGIYMSSFALAQLLGPTVGGVLATEFGWRWAFWFNVPFGVICLIWGLRVIVRIPRTREPLRLDLPGNLLILFGLCGLLLGLSEVVHRGWGSPLVVIGLSCFAIALPLFLYVEYRSKFPVVDLAVFREPVVGLGVAAGFFATMSLFAVVLLMGLYFQAVQGDTPTEAGVKILPLAVTSMITSPIVGFILRRVRARTVAVTAAMVSLSGLVVLLCTISATTPFPLIVVAMVLIGVGSGGFIPANSTAMLSEVPEHRLGIANAVRIMAQSSGVAISTALILTIISAPLAIGYREQIFQGTLSNVSRAAVNDLVVGYRWALGLMVAMSVLCVLTSLANRRINSSDKTTGAPVLISTANSDY